jgi:hypothetical protein
MQHYETKRQILVKLRTLLLERKSFRTTVNCITCISTQNETLFNSPANLSSASATPNPEREHAQTKWCPPIGKAHPTTTQYGNRRYPYDESS